MLKSTLVKRCSFGKKRKDKKSKLYIPSITYYKNSNESCTFAVFGQIGYFAVKFVFSKKATKIDEIFTVDLSIHTKCQIDGEDFVNFCGFFRQHELYPIIERIFFHFFMG